MWQRHSLCFTWIHSYRQMLIPKLGKRPKQNKTFTEIDGENTHTHYYFILFVLFFSCKNFSTYDMHLTGGCHQCWISSHSSLSVCFIAPNWIIFFLGWIIVYSCLSSDLHLPYQGIECFYFTLVFKIIHDCNYYIKTIGSNCEWGAYFDKILYLSCAFLQIYKPQLMQTFQVMSDGEIILTS